MVVQTFLRHENFHIQIYIFFLIKLSSIQISTSLQHWNMQDVFYIRFSMQTSVLTKAFAFQFFYIPWESLCHSRSLVLWFSCLHTHCQPGQDHDQFAQTLSETVRWEMNWRQNCQDGGEQGCVHLASVSFHSLLLVPQLITHGGNSFPLA